jgi:hypothetical protein
LKERDMEQLTLFDDMPNKTVEPKTLKPRQLDMFSATETSQKTGGHYAPEWRGKLALESEDPRTPDQIETDRQQTAQAQTARMF